MRDRDRARNRERKKENELGSREKWREIRNRKRNSQRKEGPLKQMFI